MPKLFRGKSRSSASRRRISRAERFAALPGYPALRAGLTLVEQVIVILVLGILLAIFMPLLSEFTFLQSSEDQAGNLARHLSAARNTAIKANRLVYFEFDLDEDIYSAYTYARESSELKKEPLIEETSARLVGVAAANGTKITEGKITLKMQPSGVAEEMAIYLGSSEDEIYATMLFSRYTGEARVEPEEVLVDLKRPEWRHDPE
ncbi:MAG: hypothetical protein NXI24_20135 [bacterium]|nr:hypothetical protein [bacterium]